MSAWLKIEGRTPKRHAFERRPPAGSNLHIANDSPGRRAPVPPALALIFLVSAFSLCAAPSPTFEKDVRPILKAHCFDCHGEGEKLKGGLDLRLRRLMVKGGDDGPVIVPGNAEKSPLYKLVDSGEMPKREKKLTRGEVALIKKWIAAGAKTARPEPAEIARGATITDEERAFWSFQPIRNPAVPPTKPKDRVRTPIDAFLVSAMTPRKLTFSPDAEKVTLLRRACLDLTGLPPTPAETDAFLADTAPDAYEQLIDRLLDSPHYGERWGRHWLDVAGYADSDGYSDADPPRAYAYKYRDYAIDSFNADKPFDRFITEQIAGDELAGVTRDNPQPALATPHTRELLIATGFLRMGADGTATPAIDDYDPVRNQVIADTLKIVSTSVLGLSVGCAQCHDHRYDPIPQTDYYRLRAIFEPAYDPKNWRTPDQRLVSLYTDADRKAAAQVEADARKLAEEKEARQKQYIDDALAKHLEKFEPDLRAKLRSACDTPVNKRTAEQKKLLADNPSVNINPGVLYQYNQKAADDLKAMDAKIAEIRSRKPHEDFISALTEPAGKIPVTYVFHRGDPKQPGEPVQPGWLTVLTPPRSIRREENPSKPSSDEPASSAPRGIRREENPSTSSANDPALSAPRSIRREENPSNSPACAQSTSNALQSTGRRLAFAHWLTSGTNPLVARVLINRIWLHHFGRGIVATPSDFGAMGERPTHPELLDWLASDFVDHGWRLKRLHKLIMTSTAYRQSSGHNATGDERDPDNRSYWRKPVQRLDAEIIRDSILATSGALNNTMYGPPVPVRPDVNGQIVVGLDKTQGDNKMPVDVSLNGEEFRRSIYIQVRRSRPLAVLHAFDAPVMEVNCDRRQSSTVPTQSLMLMNSQFILDQASRFAARLQKDAGEDRARQIDRAWQLAFSRKPTVKESAEAIDFLSRQAQHLKRIAETTEAKPKDQKDKPAANRVEAQALTDLCQALLSCNEFLYVD